MEVKTMTTTQLVDLMNELTCQNQGTRAAILTALREPSVENVQRAIAASPDYVEKFIACMFDGGAPVLFEAPLWLHCYHHQRAAAADLPLPTAVASLDEVPNDPTEPAYLTTTSDVAATVGDGARFRVVRVKDGAVTANVTRPMTQDECRAYLSLKGTPSMAIVDVTTGRVLRDSSITGR